MTGPSTGQASRPFPAPAVAGSRAAAVVTGLGVVAPTGIGAAAHWERILQGRACLTPLDRFDPARYAVRLAGQVSGFRAAEQVPGRLVPQTDRWTHLGLLAAELALADAGVDPSRQGGPGAYGEYDMGVMTASSSGGTEFGQREIQALWSRGPKHVGPYQAIAWFYAATTGQISIRHGMRGPTGVLATEQAGALDVLAQARRAVRTGTGLVVAGGTDSSLCPYGLVAQSANGKLSTVDEPTRAYLPFDVDASGYVPGEGGAMLIVEHPESAARRSADTPYGEVAGYAASFDPPPWSGRSSTLQAAIEAALADAGIGPGDVDVVLPDASGVPRLDRIEAAALASVFGRYGVAVTAPKTMTGRLYAGGAALDVATALLALRHDVIPPTAGVSLPAPQFHLDLVLERPRQAALRTALVVARGHGGFNAALVLRSVVS